MTASIEYIFDNTLNDEVIYTFNSWVVPDEKRVRELERLIKIMEGE